MFAIDFEKIGLQLWITSWDARDCLFRDTVAETAIYAASSGSCDIARQCADEPHQSLSWPLSQKLHSYKSYSNLTEVLMGIMFTSSLPRHNPVSKRLEMHHILKINPTFCTFNQSRCPEARSEITTTLFLAHAASIKLNFLECNCFTACALSENNNWKLQVPLASAKDGKQSSFVYSKQRDLWPWTWVRHCKCKFHFDFTT